MEKTITGIKKAVGEFNNWQGCARIYFDKSTGEVWTNIYASGNSWNEYHDESIIQIYSKSTVRMDERDDKITMAKLKEICQENL